MAGPDLQAVVAFGVQAQAAVTLWQPRPAVPIVEVPHPSSRDAARLAEAWREAVDQLRLIVSPDPDGEVEVPNYGAGCRGVRLPADPPYDLPFGVPGWLGDDAWDVVAVRSTTTASSAQGRTSCTPWSGGRPADRQGYRRRMTTSGTPGPELTVDGVRSAMPYVDTWLDFQRTYLRVPGVQVAVLIDGEVVLSNAYGLADVEGRWRSPASTSSGWPPIPGGSRPRRSSSRSGGRLRLDDPVVVGCPSSRLRRRSSAG